MQLIFFSWKEWIIEFDFLAQFSITVVTLNSTGACSSLSLCSRSSLPFGWSFALVGLQVSEDGIHNTLSDVVSMLPLLRHFGASVSEDTDDTDVFVINLQSSIGGLNVLPGASPESVNHFIKVLIVIGVYLIDWIVVAQWMKVWP
ncbi:hypothetical protein Tco_0138859 [Tanacetum coccineum]